MMVSGFIRQNELLEKLRRQSREDAQTGLLNLRAFREETQRVLAAADAESDQLSFFAASIDNFREFNEKVGDATSGQLISAVGALIEGALPPGSLLARSGNEEFAAMVPAIRAVTVESMQRLLDELSEELGNLPQTIGVSVGVAVYPWDGDSPEALVDAARQAMFLAKSGGGHRVCVYEPGEIEARGERVVAEQIAAAEADQETTATIPEPSPQPAAPQLAGLQAALLESKDLENALAEWASDIEAKNPYGKDHSKKVAELAVALARAMGMSDQDVRAVKLAGLAHNLGRSTIPDEILNKSGKYTDAERQLLEEAPAKAAEMLEGVAALAPVQDFVRYHQERWDGSGHPSRLQGDQIPLGAQIVGICDVFQTLISPRSYRPAMEEEQARDIISRGADKVWNPELANTFVSQVVAPTEMAAASDQEST
jgi:diguanylate cyclase (GGDEF)-like protein